MVFKDKFDIHKFPQWKEFYFDYLQLKYMLKEHSSKNKLKSKKSNGENTKSKQNHSKTCEHDIENPKYYGKEAQERGIQNPQEIELKVENKLQSEITDSIKNNCDHISHFPEIYKQKIMNVEKFFTHVNEIIKNDMNQLTELMKNQTLENIKHNVFISFYYI